jgi:hypothetical protein
VSCQCPVRKLHDLPIRSSEYKFIRFFKEVIGGRTRTRTLGPLIKSHPVSSKSRWLRIPATTFTERANRSRSLTGPGARTFPSDSEGERSHRRLAVPSSRKLWRALREVDTYLRGQSTRLVNYAKSYRAGLRVGTSVIEGTANFLVNRRMNKAQQLRWSRRGADLLLQVRCAVYNGAFGAGFGKLLEPTSNTVPQSLPLAA